MQLTDSERQSPLWAKIEGYLKEQIDASHLELEKTYKNDKALGDDIHKGMILAHRRLLAKARTEQGRSGKEPKTET